MTDSTTPERSVRMGVFLPVASGGWIVSTDKPDVPGTYADNRAITVLAEELGFDFVLSMAKWRGYGGPSHHWDRQLESMSTMMALAEATDRIGLWATVHTMVFHPAVAAKMIATLDEISGGRAGMNIVAGSNPFDQGQMGLWRDLDHDERYRYAAEWMTVVKRLWSEERVTFHGEYFDLDDCMSNPKPAVTPEMICAGASDAGLRFSIEHCGKSFVNAASVPVVQERGRRVHELSAEIGREGEAFGLFLLVPGADDAEALARVARYDAAVDIEALTNRSREYATDKPGNTTAERFILQAAEAKAVPPTAIAGSPDTIADTLAEIALGGQFDGMVFTVPDFADDVTTIAREILPRLAERGVVSTSALRVR